MERLPRERRQDRLFLGNRRKGDGSCKDSSAEVLRRRMRCLKPDDRGFLSEAEDRGTFKRWRNEGGREERKKLL